MRNLAVLALIVLLSGCAQTSRPTPTPSPETEAFQGSPLQRELNAGLDRCMELKAAGKLPGFPAGVRPDEEYSSGGYDLSRSRQVSYPLRLNCSVSSGGQRQTFTFVKNTAGSHWELGKSP